MIFAEELTAAEREKLTARIMEEISPPKPRPKPRQKRLSKSLTKTNANMRKYCKPPESCFECPFPDCVAGTGTKGFGKRSDKEIEYLNNAFNKTDNHKEMMT